MRATRNYLDFMTDYPAQTVTKIEFSCAHVLSVLQAAGVCSLDVITPITDKYK